MAWRVRPLMEKWGHTSLFRCMVALWLASQSLAPGQRQTDSFRRWVETHEDALFLPAASIVEVKAAIKSIPASQAIRADALDKWLDNFVTNFKDVMHPVDVKVAMRAGSCALGAELFSPIVSVTRCLLRRRRSMVMAC